MKWNDYEELVKDIYQVMGKASGVEIECFGNKCKRTGKSSVSHQIDVLTKHSDGIHTYYTIIECKYSKKKINKDIVMKVHEILDDLNYNKAVIVTKKGYTPDALKFAEHRNVEITSELELHGMITGSAIVKDGEILQLHGMVSKSVVVEPGGIANISGMVSGNAINKGGELHISGTVVGNLIKESGTTNVESHTSIGNA